MDDSAKISLCTKFQSTESVHRTLYVLCTFFDSIYPIARNIVSSYPECIMTQGRQDKLN